MSFLDPAKPRLVQRVGHWVRDGLPSPGRYRRYGLIVLPAVAAIWAATGLFLVTAPPRYDSEFTLILPGTGAGGSINVESIGQAQSSAASAFSSSTLSPTENYKRLLMTDVTLRQAAQLTGEKEESFPKPVIKLIDQTNLIEVAVAGRTPEQARKRALALRQAFLAQLDRLRADEADKREASDAKHLIELEAKVRETQQKLLAFQAEHGLVSLDQFNARIAGIDSLREKERESRTSLRQLSAESSRLNTVTGTSPGRANVALRLRSDPVFQRMAERFAMLDADAEQKSATLGDAHSDMAQANGERDQLRAALLKRGQELTGLSQRELMNQVDISISDGRSNLAQGQIAADARRSGAAAGLAEIQGDLARQQRQSAKLVNLASVLADLTRDHRVAEAVFSTALARLDTNKQDPFASYPLVQTLEQPSLPRDRASPSLPILLGGALAATILLLLGFGLTWFRQPLIRKLLPNA